MGSWNNDDGDDDDDDDDEQPIQQGLTYLG